MIESCGHGSGSGTHVRALDLVKQSYQHASRRDAPWRALSQQARSLCSAMCAEVAHGRRDGTVPVPGTAQWDDYLDRRTGTTREARADMVEPVQTKRQQGKKTSTKSKGSQQRRQKEPPASRHPLRQVAFERFTHATLAKSWAAVQGDQVSTRVLAVLLKVPHTQESRYARDISEVLEAPPWRLRVRGGVVSATRLQDRCDDILRELQDDL